MLAILAYHQIGEPSPGGWHTWYHIPEETFVSQLGYLREHGWEVIDGATLLRGLEEPASLPARAALLTFDDAYRSAFTVALPRLLEFGYPAVLFVPTEYVGDLNRFDADTDEPEEPLCSWDELRELEAAGVSVESHGVSHRSFSELSPAEIEDELERSKAVLEGELGKVVELFAFPYGEVGTDPAAVRTALARCGYRAAHLYHGGATDLAAIDDRFQLPRVPLGVDSDLAVELAWPRTA
jgi:peptidoglycan/xylan/chitin deacetylase (PgdA/CDA1 family)